LLRSNYISLVEERYFGSVSRKDIAAVLDCFTSAATVRIYHGDAEPRRFQRDGADGDHSPLEDFYQHLCRNYDPSFSEFTHYVDTEAGRCACTFLVTLVPCEGSAYAESGTQRLRNCNFFTYEADLITDMTIYYANPSAAAGGPVRPTGYPRRT
jgi:hypothetical protein